MPPRSTGSSALFAQCVSESLAVLRPPSTKALIALLPAELIPEQGEVHVSLDEPEPLPTIGIGPERHRSTREVGRGEGGQEPMNRSRMWIRRPTDFSAHSHDRTCVCHATGQDFLGHTHRMPEVMAAMRQL
jgi:hypothetical protein